MLMTSQSYLQEMPSTDVEAMSDTETSLDCGIDEIEATLATPKPKKPHRDRPSRQTVY